MPEIGALLAVKDLQAWYGESHVLHGVDFEVRPGEVVTLLGRNGVGKTTTLKAIMGIIESRTGSVRYEGTELIARSSDVIAKAGIAFCPEERGIFSSLYVKENLLLPPQVRPGGLDLERIFALFPNLRERLSSQGTKLSGGESAGVPCDVFSVPVGRLGDCGANHGAEESRCRIGFLLVRSLRGLRCDDTEL